MSGNVVYSAGVLWPRFLLAALLLLGILFIQTYLEVHNLRFGYLAIFHFFFYLLAYPFCYALGWCFASRRSVIDIIASASSVGGIMLGWSVILSYVATWSAIIGFAFVDKLAHGWHLYLGPPSRWFMYSFAACAGAAFGYGLYLMQRWLLGEPSAVRFSMKRVHVLWATIAAPVIMHVSSSTADTFPTSAAKLALTTNLVIAGWLTSVLHMVAIWLCLPRSPTGAEARQPTWGRSVRYALGLVSAACVGAVYYHYFLAKLSVA
jgi:hypothetical protein